MTAAPRVTAVAALALDGVIGKDNAVPWRLPADLRRFRALTIGRVVVMGRRTYQSIGKPLAKRTNVVLTRDGSFAAPGCVVARSVDEAVEIARREGTDLAVIGGAVVYADAMPRCDRLELTLVEGAFDGDTFFPAIDRHEWLVAAREDHAADAENPHAYHYVTLDRVHRHEAASATTVHALAWPELLA